jgi:hypothetical protein
MAPQKMPFTNRPRNISALAANYNPFNPAVEAHTSQRDIMNRNQINKIETTADQINAETLALWTAGDLGGLTTNQRSPRPASREFGGIVDDRKGSSLGDFTDEDFEELARRDPQFRAKLAEQKQDDITNAFLKRNPEYLPNQNNYEEICKYIRSNQLRDPLLDLDDVLEKAFEAGFWTIGNLESIVEKLTRQGKLEQPKGKAKTLSSEEKVLVLALVRQGDTAGALARYLSYALPNHTIINYDDLARDYPQLVHAAVWFVWRSAHPEIPEAEFSAFFEEMRQHHLPTISMLDGSYQVHREEKYFAPATQHNQPMDRAVQKDRDISLEEARELGDDELNKLITRARMEYRR